MYRTILAAIDFSDTSVAAARWTAAAFPDAGLVLFHAIDPTPSPGYLVRALGERAGGPAERELDARSNLEHLAEELGVPARLSLRVGWPPVEVRQAAAEAEAELVVVGAHRKRVSPFDEPGATAESIVEESELPVLVWRAPAEKRERTVLAALDLREASPPVAAAAAEWARWLDARLVLLHALPRTYQAYLRAVSAPAKVEESVRSIAAAAREAALDSLPAAVREELEVEVRVTRGRPTTQILAAAEAEAADLIVAGQSYAPAFRGHPLLGGVTGRLIRSANCSVLCVTGE